ncbi:3-beta hydroxysteroid dehydrogenase/isomerase, partial [Terfezia claveryi]
LPPTLITGGCGFIGKTLIQYILARHPRAKLAITDKQPPLSQYLGQDNITFHQIDLTDKVAVEKLLEETRPELIIGVAGLIPDPKIKDRDPFFIDNVSAIRTLVQGCQSILLEKLSLHVRGFVHTSSSDTVKGTRELAGVDERTPYPKVFFDVYSESKAQGEQIVLAANCPEFPTTCLRPHGILGAEGHIMPMMYQSLKNNETVVQIGDNKNLYDFVDVENYCAAVLLTVYNLLTNGDPISAAGHTFFITNLEPVYFWSWTRRVWGWLAQESNKFHEQAPLKIPKAVGLALAYATELFTTTVRGKDPGLTKARIQECCYNRWFRGDKAGHVLGY